MQAVALILCSFCAADEPKFAPGDWAYPVKPSPNAPPWCVKSSFDIKTVRKYAAAKDGEGISKLRLAGDLGFIADGVEIKIIERYEKGSSPEFDVYEVRITWPSEKAFPGYESKIPDRPIMYMEARYLSKTKPEKVEKP